MFAKLLKKAVGDRYDIVPPQLAIKAMRSSGFRGTDNAVAELIDNSIQSGLEAGNKCTNIEVLCIEAPKNEGQRSTTRITQIAVYDNAAGMDAETLRYAMMFGVGTRLSQKDQKGIGKFGMGLPNASISQCKHVDVYSWKDGKVLKTYLNVEDIQNGTLREVPEPEKSELPANWKSLIKSDIGDTGTLVVWSQLDRPSWVRHKAFFNNAEFLIGRMYRTFIADGTVKIRLAAFSRSGGSNVQTLADAFVRPNDPMMLMKGTMAPAPYDKEPAFQEFGNPDRITIKTPDGKESVVTIRYSLAKQETRDTDTGAAGSTPIGKFVAKNLGVSIVRAGRELELNTSWNNPSEPRERWWGIEISFEPELDEIFGVTNDKQSATNLFRCDPAEDAKNEGLSKADLFDNLAESLDPRLSNYTISTAIAKRLSTIRDHIRKQREGTLAESRGASGANDAETFASLATKRRIETTGQKSKSDIEHETTSQEEKKNAIKEHLIEGGCDEEAAEAIAVESVSNDVRYHFAHTKLNSAAIFDVVSERGESFIKLNTNHPAHEHFIELLRNEDGSGDTPALKGLKLLLTAWARMEDEATERDLEKLQDTRADWGRIARDFIRESTGDIEE